MTRPIPQNTRGASRCLGLEVLAFAGARTGHRNTGIAQNLRHHYSPWMLRGSAADHLRIAIRRAG